MSARLTEKLKVTSYDFDPDATTETEIAWVDARDFGSFLAQFVRTVGTSALTLEIQASASSDGSDPVTVKEATLAAQPDAVGDTVFVEVDEDEITNAGTDLRYVSAVVSVATATDEGVVNYILGDAKHCKADLTADVVA